MALIKVNQRNIVLEVKGDMVNTGDYTVGLHHLVEEMVNYFCAYNTIFEITINNIWNQSDECDSGCGHKIDYKYIAVDIKIDEMSYGDIDRIKTLGWHIVAVYPKTSIVTVRKRIRR